MSVGQHDAPLPDSIGVLVDPITQKNVNARIKELLEWKGDGFPGSQPVSFDSTHLKVLEQEDYYVCEKSDGVRYLMFAQMTQKGPATFVICRKNLVRYIPNLVFPVKDRPGRFQNDTLLDGELVLDVKGDEKISRFLVFDLLVINGVNVTQRSLSSRLGYARDHVVNPLISAKEQNLEFTRNAPCLVAMKHMERSYGITQVFEQIKELHHGNDGLIFTPVKQPYILGTCKKMLKWKPADQNTVDFKICIRWSRDRKPIFTLHSANRGVHQFYDFFTPDPELAENWRTSSPDGRIGEFLYDPEWPTYVWNDPDSPPHIRKGGWRFTRYRDDKNLANDERVVKKILRSIADGVTREELETSSEKIRAAWKLREANGGRPPGAIGNAPIQAAHHQGNTNGRSKFPDAVPLAPSSASGSRKRRPEEESGDHQRVDDNERKTDKRLKT
ncbi:uncharacterized protein VTP21DRAFT_185 [Calcarisporiella thermophila]|uniref:uncharacterized protein n=1 Tax=Calcarisporiella thermophila TaxID=911321 RepID=UPI003742A080